MPRAGTADERAVPTSSDAAHVATSREDAAQDDQEQLYENEREEKEMQYQRHKQMISEYKGKYPFGGYKYGVARRTPFSCPTCNRGFSKRKQYERHVKTHNPINECRYCNFKCRNKKQFEAHELKHLKENPQFECEICQAKYATSSLLRGHKSRNHGLFHCVSCNYVAKSHEDRNDHMVVVHRKKFIRRTYQFEKSEDEDDDQLEQHTCELCDRTCRSRALLKIHIAQHMNVSPSRLTDDFELCDDLPPDDTSDVSDEAQKYPYTPPRSSKRRNTSENDPPAKKIAFGMDKTKNFVNDPEVNLLARIRPASKNATFRCGKCDLKFVFPNELFTHVVLKHTFLEYDAQRRLKEMQLQAPMEDRAKK